MKNHNRIFSGAACMLLSLAALSGCTETLTVEAGRYEDYSQNPGEAGDLEKTDIAPLRNPDRGFFVESNFLLQKAGGEYKMYNPYVKTNEGVFTETDPATVYAARMNSYGDFGRDSLTLVQQYVYLTPWISEDLDQTAIDLTKDILDAVKSSGLQTLLRFAYSYDRENSIADNITLDKVKKHISQLSDAGIFSDYKGTIATLQSGFFGDWGEWAGADDTERKDVMDALLEVFPEDYSIGIRYPADKKRLGFCDDAAVSARIGYNNDYFTAGTHAMASGNDYVGDDYTQVKDEAEKYNAYICGELPQNEGGTWGLSDLLPLTDVLKTLKEHRYSSLDVSQNYELNITNWKSQTVTADMLASYEILFDESYFMNEEGTEVSRSFFDFVRDHLGYRLNLSSESAVSAEGGQLSYDLSLTNTGFSTVVNPKEVYIVLIASDGTIAQKIKTDADSKTWMPWSDDPTAADVHTVSGTASLTASSGTYKVGIWMPDPNITDTAAPASGDAQFDIRFALNGAVTHWWSADKSVMVNVFSEITF